MGKPFTPTAAHRRKVELLVARIPEEGIAKLIGIDRMTLRKYFADELANGRQRVLARCMEELEKQAKKGNVSAIKELVRLQTHVNQAPVFIGEASQPQPDQPQPDPRLGKKEQANVISETAADGTVWAKYVN